jgi:hypothetical protein
MVNGGFSVAAQRKKIAVSWSSQIPPLPSGLSQVGTFRVSQSASGQEIEIAAAVVHRKMIMLHVGHITSVTNPIPTATDSKTATPAT